MTELLRRYYAEQAWDIATPEEFRALAEEVAGESLADLWPSGSSRKKRRLPHSLIEESHPNRFVFLHSRGSCRIVRI